MQSEFWLAFQAYMYTFLKCGCDFTWMHMHATIARIQDFSHIFIWPRTKAYTLQRHRGLDQTRWVQVGNKCTQLSPSLRSLHLWRFYVFAHRSHVDYNPGILIWLNELESKWKRISNKSDVGTRVKLNPWHLAVPVIIMNLPEGISWAQLPSCKNSIQAHLHLLTVGTT